MAPPSGVAEREETSRNDEWSVPFLSISRCKLTIAARVSRREKAKKKKDKAKYDDQTKKSNKSRGSSFLLRARKDLLTVESGGISPKMLDFLIYFLIISTASLLVFLGMEVSPQEHCLFGK